MQLLACEYWRCFGSKRRCRARWSVSVGGHSIRHNPIGTTRTTMWTSIGVPTEKKSVLPGHLIRSLKYIMKDLLHLEGLKRQLSLSHHIL